MSIRASIRLKSKPGLVRAGAIAACLAFSAATASPGQEAAHPLTQPANAAVLDRVVAVVNNQAILASDVDDEVQLAVLDPAEAGLGNLTRQRALDQLISRALIQQQIRQEDAQTSEPVQSEVDARLTELRKNLPACVHLNCASEEGWKAFLGAHGLTPARVETYLRNRLQVLDFIELRFRQGIRISPEEIETYYRETLLPQYAVGEAIPPLETVSPRIEEILLERQVNVLFDEWLKNLRKQGDVEILDPALESPDTSGKGGA
jgi:peptidyl-prolyl cis-trans isomerase SurA